ncbi:MAG: hypothetical protein AAGA18_04415 [Verrucomicrobiota bacterium]
MKFPGIKKINLQEGQNKGIKSLRQKIRDTAKVTMSIPFRELLEGLKNQSDDRPDELELPEALGSKRFFDIAREQLGMNRPKCAAKAANKGMKQEDVDLHVACILWTDIGNAMYDAAEKEGAIEAFKKAHELNDAIVPTIFNLGVAYQVNGELSKAEQHYESVLEINEACEEAWSNMGVVHFYRDEIDESEKATRKALKINSKSIFAMDNLASLLAIKGLFLDALDVCFDVIDIDDQFKQAWLKVGLIYFEQRSYDLSENALNKARGLQILDGMIAYHLGLISVAKGNLISAYTRLEEAMNIDPKSEIGITAWEKLKEQAALQNNMVMVSQAEKKIEKIKEAFEQQKDATPSTALAIAS